MKNHVGTAGGVYSIWVLMQDETERLFSVVTDVERGRHVDDVEIDSEH